MAFRFIRQSTVQSKSPEKEEMFEKNYVTGFPIRLFHLQPECLFNQSRMRNNEKRKRKERKGKDMKKKTTVVENWKTFF